MSDSHFVTPYMFISILTSILKHQSQLCNRFTGRPPSWVDLVSVSSSPWLSSLRTQFLSLPIDLQRILGQHLRTFSDRSVFLFSKRLYYIPEVIWSLPNHHCTHMEHVLSCVHRVGNLKGFHVQRFHISRTLFPGVYNGSPFSFVLFNILYSVQPTPS